MVISDFAKYILQLLNSNLQKLINKIDGYLFMKRLKGEAFGTPKKPKDSFKGLIFALLLVLFTSFSIAGNIITLDFVNKTDYNIAFQKGEGIRFDFKNLDNKITVRGIRSEKEQVDITIFVEGAEVPFYQTVSSKVKVDLDFDRDDVKDMEIRLFGFRENNTGVLSFNRMSSFEGKVIKDSEGFSFDFGSFKSLEGVKDFVKTYLLYVILGVLVLLLLVVERRTLLRGYRRIKRGMRI